MTAALPSTVAQLLFTAPLAMPLDHIVNELSVVLERYPAATRRISREGGSAAIFDLDGSRVVIALHTLVRGQLAACLTVSVGSAPGATAAGPLSDRRTSLCRRIADRLGARCAIDDVIWHEIAGPATPDLLGRMTETLSAAGAERLRPRRVSRRTAGRAVGLSRAARPQMRGVPPTVAAPSAAAPAWEPVAVGGDSMSLACAPGGEAARIRAALYPPRAAAADDRPSVRLRLAVHAMNAIMILALLPVGAAMMTHSVLRGEDLHLTARMMSLTGLLLALGQSRLGQQVLSVI